MNTPVKTRFAPSPTGYLHIGGIRTALYNYLFARQNDGKFVVRIEDTDQKRYVPGSEIQLLEILKKMGLQWDEGPVVVNSRLDSEKGENGPYFQSKRLKIYQQYSHQLIQNDKAYYCFCTEKRLADLKNSQNLAKIPTKYDGLCRKLSESEIKANFDKNLPFTVRLKVPESREIIFNDLIRGKITINSTEVDDQILIKTDGFPTYHLAVVVDDYSMGITHVIRGEEWLPSTPKHVLLYHFFNWPLPVYAHLPLLLNPDRSKLSKRQGDVAAEDFLNKGYLPEALINYIALMGWHPADNTEIFSMENLIKTFDLSKVQKAGAVFDTKKLNWFNNYYLKQKGLEELYELSKNWLKYDKNQSLKILALLRDRLEKLSDLETIINEISNLPDYHPENLIYKKSDLAKSIKGLELASDYLSEEGDLDAEKIKNSLSGLAAENHLNNGDLFWPLRVSLSGAEKSAPPEELIIILGKNEALKRISFALEKLKKIK